MKLILSILCICFSYSVKRTYFSASQANEDLQFLREELTTYHSGLHRYISKDSMDLLFEMVKVDQDIDSYQLYSKISFILSHVRCGHTRSVMSASMRSSFEQDQTFLPFTIKILKGRCYVDQSLDPGLMPGDQIISINGKSDKEIQEIVFSRLPADGWITTSKKRRFEFLFDSYYQLFVDPNATQYEVSFRNLNDEIDFVKLDGISWDKINSLRNSSRSKDSYLSLRMNDDYAYLRIRTFSSSAIQNQGLDYETFLNESFQTINRSGTTNLILDLRGNGGGSDNYGALLVSYFAKEPFKYFEKIEVTKKYPGKSKKEGDTYLMTSHKGLSVWEPQKNRFDGDVYVLIDGFSFSTCADVATVLHFHNWATFIGEETGGGYDGNTSGHTRTINLPNSKVTVNIPMWKYTTANFGHSFPGRGVMPDYAIEPSWQEYSQEKDVVMEKALELIK